MANTLSAEEWSKDAPPAVNSISPTSSIKPEAEKEGIFQEALPANKSDDVDVCKDDSHLDDNMVANEAGPMHKMFEGMLILEQDKEIEGVHVHVQEPHQEEFPVLVNEGETSTDINPEAESKQHIYLLIDDRFCGGLIGRGGKVIDTIREESQANICLQDRRVKFYNHPPKRALKVLGPVDSILKAITSTSKRLLEVKAANVAFKNNTDVQTMTNPTLEITFLSPLGVLSEEFRAHSQIVVESHGPFELIDVWGVEDKFNGLVSQLLKNSTLGSSLIEESNLTTAFTRNRGRRDFDGQNGSAFNGDHSRNQRNNHDYNKNNRGNDTHRNNGYHNNSNNNNNGYNRNRNNRHTITGNDRNDNYHRQRHTDNDNNNNNNENHYSNNRHNDRRTRQDGQNDNSYRQNRDGYKYQKHNDNSNYQNNYGNNNGNSYNRQNNTNNNTNSQYKQNSDTASVYENSTNASNLYANGSVASSQKNDIWKKKNSWEHLENNNRNSGQYFEAFSNSKGYNGSIPNIPKDVWEDV